MLGADHPIGLARIELEANPKTGDRPCSGEVLPSKVSGTPRDESQGTRQLPMEVSRPNWSSRLPNLQREYMQITELNQIKDPARRPCNCVGMAFDARLLIALLISLATGLTGGPRAHAMGANGNLVAMVICSENGAQTIYANADGTPALPTSDCAKCPLCIALTAAALVAPEQSVHVRTARRYRGVRSVATIMQTRRYVRQRSRGPPPETPDCIDPARAVMVRDHPPAAGIGLIEAGSPDLGTCRRYGRYFKDARQ